MLHKKCMLNSLPYSMINPQKLFLEQKKDKCCCLVAFLQNQLHLSSTNVDISMFLQNLTPYIHRKRSCFYPLSYVFVKLIIARFLTNVQRLAFCLISWVFGTGLLLNDYMPWSKNIQVTCAK